MTVVNPNGVNPKPAASTQTYTPTTGGTVNGVAAAGDVIVDIAPAADLLNLTLNLPSVPIGNSVFVTARKNVTTLVLGGASSILNTVVALVAGTTLEFIRVDATTYSRVG